MQVNTAIIIAGGTGSRMKEIGNDDNGVSSLPKPMIHVYGKSILERNINWLKKHGIKNIIIGVAYKKGKIIEYFGNGKEFGVNIKYSEHSTEDGTGDAFRKAIENTELKEKYFYALNSDQLTDFDITKLADHHVNAALATILLVYPTYPFGIVEIDDGGWVVEFKEKPKIEKFSNGGIYLFDMNIKDYLEGDVEKNTFVKLSKKKKIQTVKYEGFWDTINTFKDLKRVDELFRNGLKI
jgi:NDP-sugar pyrophosphorylase family protein